MNEIATETMKAQGKEVEGQVDLKRENPKANLTRMVATFGAVQKFNKWEILKWIYEKTQMPDPLEAAAANEQARKEAQDKAGCGAERGRCPPRQVKKEVDNVNVEKKSAGLTNPGYLV